MTIQHQPGVPLAPTGSIEATSQGERRARQIGIALMCGSYLCFACLDATAKYLGHHIPTMEVVWARYLGATILALVAVNPLSSPNVFRTRHFWLQNLRALTLFASTILNFYALRSLQLADTVSITFALPLVVALLAGPMLGEWVGPRRLAAICVGFIGVLVVTRPGFGGFHPAMLLIMVGTVLYALYGIWTRVLAGHDSSRTTLAYSSILGAVLLTPTLPFFWVWPENGLIWLLMAATGLFGALGHWLLILAHRRAPAAILAPFIYTEIIWMTLLGFTVFGDVPQTWTLVGAAIVIASGLYLWYRERVVKGGGKV